MKNSKNPNGRFASRPHRLNRQILATLTASTLAGAAHASGALTSLDPYAGNAGAWVQSVSADGSTAVGWSYNGSALGMTPILWSDGTAIQIDNDIQGLATAVSADGNVIAGSYLTGLTQPATAFRWDMSNGFQGLARIADTPTSAFHYIPWDASADGSVIVGDASSRFPTSGSAGLADTGDPALAIRWQGTGGEILRAANGDTSFGGGLAKAKAVSSDGSTIVGYSSNTNQNLRAFRWQNQQTGMVDIGDLGGSSSVASDVSGDGNAVVGTSLTGATNITQRAFRWTPSAGMVNLGGLEAGLPSQANAISDDGKVVVGHAGVSDPNVTDSSGRPTAFRWTESGGMESVAQWLGENGVQVTNGNKLATATDTNSDGSVIVGNNSATADAPRAAWIARVSPTKSGIIEDIPEYRESVARAAGSTTQATASLPNLALFGSHHRPLRLSGFTRTDASGACAWATADAAGQTDPDVDVQLAEAGVCSGVGSSSVIGVGVGRVWAKQDLDLGGSADVDGQYVVAEGDYLMPNDLLLSALAYYGRFNGEIKRNYRNGADRDTSIGEPDTTGTAARLRADWLDAARIARVSLTPYISYTWSKTQQDAYQEQGGFDPLAINDVEWETNDVRLGLGGTLPLTDMTSMHVAAEIAHRLEDSTSGIQINDSIIGPMTFEGREIEQTWGRLTVDVDYKLSKRHALTFGANAATDGADPTWGVTVGLRSRF